jgi:hypothetical protein
MSSVFEFNLLWWHNFGCATSRCIQKKMLVFNRFIFFFSLHRLTSEARHLNKYDQFLICNQCSFTHFNNFMFFSSFSLSLCYKCIYTRCISFYSSNHHRDRLQLIMNQNLMLEKIQVDESRVVHY